MPAEPTEHLKSKLTPEIVEMIRAYNNRSYEINRYALCEQNDKFDAQLVSQYYPSLLELYENERQKLKNYAITSSRIYNTNQEKDIYDMETYLTNEHLGWTNDEHETRFQSAKQNITLYEEALRIMEFKRDYLFLEQVVRYYRVSVLIRGGLT
jgi:hypothetical protein